MRSNKSMGTDADVTKFFVSVHRRSETAQRTRLHHRQQIAVERLWLCSGSRPGRLARRAPERPRQPANFQVRQPGRSCQGAGPAHQSKSASGTYTTPSKMRRAVRTNEARSTTGAAPEQSVTSSSPSRLDGFFIPTPPQENPYVSKEGSATVREGPGAVATASAPVTACARWQACGVK